MYRYHQIDGMMAPGDVDTLSLVLLFFFNCQFPD